MSDEPEGPYKIDPDDLPPRERQAAMDNNIRLLPKAEKPRPAGSPILLTEAQAIAQLRPQEWLIQNMLERGYVYSLTGPTGSGKTAAALMMAYTIGNSDMSPNIGRLEVERGRVIFMAGENPIDIKRRLVAMRCANSLIVESAIGIIDGVFAIDEHFEMVKTDIEIFGPASLVIVDTAAAFAAINAVTEENSNTEMGKYAQMLRRLTTLPGNPAVLVLCHPAKAAATEREAMIPRGGSAFLAEVDGNLVLLPISKGVVELAHSSKLRGPGFEAMTLELLPVTHVALNDSKGRQSWSVVAKVMQEHEIIEKEAADLSDREKVVAALLFAKDGMRQAEIVATTLINKGNLSRIIADLKAEKLVSAGKLDKNRLILTDSGKKAAEKVP